MNDTIGVYNPMRYKGYYYDSETQMYYCKSRYYNPDFCRWISGDSEKYIDTETPLGLNLFIYCDNDSINKYDPSGHIAWWVALIIVVVVAMAVIEITVRIQGAVSAAKTCDGLGIDGLEKIGYIFTGLFVGNYCVVRDNWNEISQTITMDGYNETNFKFEKHKYYNFLTAHLYADYIYNNYYSNKPEYNRTELGIYIELQVHYGLYLIGNSRALDGADMGKAGFSDGEDSNAALCEIVADLIKRNIYKKTKYLPRITL